MGRINFHTKEISIKIVFYGPEGSGKTATLRQLHSTLPADLCSSMVSLPTVTDRAVEFEFLPMAMAQLRGFDVRLQLYTVPGHPHHEATREIILRDADGVVFVADSQGASREQNEESLQDLEENLEKQGTPIDEIPLVMQYNKQDESSAWEPYDLDRLLNRWNAPSVGTVATTGEDISEVLDTISRLSVRYYVRKNQKAE